MVRIVVAIMLAAAALIASPPEAGSQKADITAEADARRRINLAGRQRMLAQLMAKASCYLSLGIDEKAQINAVHDTQDLFQQTLADLRKGNGDVGLLAENDPEILSALENVEKDWSLYGQAAMRGELNVINSLNVVVLTALNDAVSLIERKYTAAGKVSGRLASAINIADRLRMLNEQAGKEHCLLAAGHEVEASRANLKSTMESVESSFRALNDGNGSVGPAPAPTMQIKVAIQAGQSEWEKLKPVLARAVAGAKPSGEDLVALSELGTQLLDAIDEIVEFYEQLP